MEQKMSLKSFSSRDDVLVNNYVFKFNKDYSKFISIRKGDFNIVSGNIL